MQCRDEMREHVMKQTIVVGKRVVGDGIYCIKKLGIIHDRRKGAIGGRQIIGKRKEGGERQARNE